MKMIKKAVSPLDMGKMIKMVEHENIAPAHIFRLFKLYLGTDCNHLLTPQGVFLQSSFNQLALVMKLRSPSELIRVVIQSGWFILGKNPEGVKSYYPIMWFASPLYLDEKQLMQEMRNENTPQQPLEKLCSDDLCGELFATQLFDSTFGAVNCIINYTGSKNIILSGRKMVPSSGAWESAVPKPERQLPEAVRAQQVDDFLNELRHSESYRGFLDSLHRQFTDPTVDGLPKKGAEKYTDEEAREIMRILMYDKVKPYFIHQDRFFKNRSFTDRVSWLTNLLAHGFGKSMISEAVKKFKSRRTYQERKAQQEAVKNVRSNRPISQYEWMLNDKRYYEDSMEGVLLLPADAPPRPSETAHWNKFTNVWFN